MSNLASVMDTSLSAMFAAQAGMSTVGHNIANANTPGYSRQQNLLAARRPLVTTFGALGRGVDIQSVRRIQDDFLLANLRKQTARRESFSMTDSALLEIEAILGSVDNDHLGNALNNFFGAWSDLANPPQDPSLKAYVLSQAESLVSDFHAVGNALDDLERNIERSVNSEVTALNDLLSQVAMLNDQIMTVEVGDVQANDLRDQRDYLITQVAEIAEVAVHEREDGSKDVILSGRTVVTRDSFEQFETVYEHGPDGYRTTVVTRDHRQPVELTPGRLEGLLASRDEHVGAVRTKLDDVARALIESVNTLHAQGRSGNTVGMPFFAGDSIHTIEVLEAIRNDPGLIAASRSGEPGDNDIALEIAALAQQGLGGPQEASVGDRYRTVLIDLAAKRGTFEFLVENQHNVVASIESKIASVSGVSLDEEGANLVRHQNAYSAAAKVISTVQEMYQSLLSMI